MTTVTGHRVSIAGATGVVGGKVVRRLCADCAPKARRFMYWTSPL